MSGIGLEQWSDEKATNYLRKSIFWGSEPVIWRPVVWRRIFLFIFFLSTGTTYIKETENDLCTLPFVWLIKISENRLMVLSTWVRAVLPKVVNTLKFLTTRLEFQSLALKHIFSNLIWQELKRCHCWKWKSLTTASNSPINHQKKDFAKVTASKQLVSVKKQPPSLCKQYSIYKELKERFLDETGRRYFLTTKILTSPSPFFNIYKTAKPPTNVFCNQRFPNLQFKGRVAVHLLRESEYLHEETQLFTRQSAGIFQRLWSSRQDISNSFAVTKNWIWDYKIPRKSLCSIL